MRFRFALLFAAVLAAGSALAQTAAEPALPVQHQAGVAAPPSAQPGQKPPAAPATSRGPAAQKVDPEKEKAIRHLMDLNGSSKLADNITQAVAFQVKTAMSRSLAGDRLQKFMDDFNQKLTARSPASEVADAEISTYAQHFSMEDLEGIIRFYESPVGQRMAKALPEVMQESQKSAADIERSAALSTLREMTDDYPELKSMLPSGEPKPSLGPGAQPQPPPNPPKPQR
jgi:uncharacterized protein